MTRRQNARRLRPLFANAVVPALAIGVAGCLCAGGVAAQSVEYRPVGARFGAFFLYPLIDITSEYNDNIFRESSGAEDDFITRINPSLVVLSDWNRHELRLEAGLEAGLYPEHGEDNYLDGVARVKGRLDILRGSEINIAVAYQRLHEDRGDDDLPGLVRSPATFDLFETDIVARYAPNRLSAELSFAHSFHNHDDADLIGPGTLENDDRDNHRLSGGVELGYAFWPGLSTFIGGGYFQRIYNATVNNGFDRDSNGWRAEGGLAFEVSRLIEARLAIGYRRESYDDPALSDTVGPSIRGEAEWSVTPLMTINLAIDTTVEETTVPGAAGTLNHLASLGVEHELLRNLVLDAELTYFREDFQGGSTPRTDNEFSFSFGARYWPNRNLSLGAQYRFALVESNAPGEDYLQNVFMLRVGAQF